jgi:hypothetical protein
MVPSRSLVPSSTALVTTPTAAAAYSPQPASPVAMAEELTQHYLDYQPTQHHYLDGRYFAVVLGPMADNVMTEPMKVTIVKDADAKVLASSVSCDMVYSPADRTYIRVVIRTPKVQHAGLLILDHAQRQAVFWNPIEGYPDEGDEAMIEQLLNDYLKTFGYQLRLEYLHVNDQQAAHSDIPTGYCNAYLIKYVLAQLTQTAFEIGDIRRFCGAIETNYHHQLIGAPEVEYHWGHGGWGRGGWGGGGAAFGGLALGAALGATTALAIGAASRPRYYPY